MLKNAYPIQVKIFWFIFLFACFFFKNGVQAKNLNVDSLYKELSSTSKAVQKAEIIIDISIQLKDNYPDSALAILNQGIDIIIKEENNPKVRNLDELLMSKAFLMYRKADILASFSRKYEQAKEYLQQAIKNGKKAADLNKGNTSRYDLLRGNVYLVKGNIAFFVNNYDSCLVNYKNASELFKITGNTSDLMRCYNNMGSVNRIMENYGPALEYLVEALNYFEETNDKPSLSAVYTNIGLIYESISDFPQAVDNFQKAMQINEEIGNTRLMAINSLNLGNVFLNLGEVQKARYYYEMSLNNNTKINNRLGMANAMINLAGVYYAINDTLRFKEFYNNGVIIFKEIQNWEGYANALHKYGETLLDLKQYDKALNTLLEARGVFSSINNRLGIVGIDEIVASFYKETGNPQKAIQIASLAYEEAVKNDFKPNSLNLSQLLSSLWEEQGNQAQALFYLKAYNAIKDELNAIESHRNVMEMEARFQSEKKQSQIDFLKNQSELDALKIKHQRLFIYLSIGVILLLFFIVFLFRSRFIIRKKYSNKLEKVIEDLRNANKQIEEKNKVRDKLFSVISHDLRSPFSGIVGLAEIIQSELDTLTKEELLEYVNLIQKTSKESLEVFENLLHWGRIQSGKINPVFTTINLHDVIGRVSVFFSNNLKLKNLGFENNIDSNCEVRGDADLIEIVIRNIISNAIKFSFSGGKIILKSQKNKSGIIIYITNFGTPIPEENLEKLFSINRNTSTRGTFNEKGTGLGLVLCKEMMELNEGKIWIQSSDAQSTTFCLLFPLKAIVES